MAASARCHRGQGPRGALVLFSSPDYPVFLIAVFFLYGLARWGGLWWARAAVMVLLADVIFLLVAKDTTKLWDPIGGILLALAGDQPIDWSLELVGRWAVGCAVLAAAIAVARGYQRWLVSDRGQRRLALGLVAGLVAMATTVAIASANHALDDVTGTLVEVGHLAIVALIGIAIGSAWQQPDQPLGRVVVLFVASSLFYHAWAAAMPGPYRYLLFLLLGTIALDYYLGIWIERASPARGRLLVIVSLCSNLGVLVFFKYTDFFTQDVLGLGGTVPRLDLILPAGISFHTFQSLSYTIDIYRKKLPATHSVIEFATFVLFFPQLVAGPIVRAQDLLPQLQQPPPLALPLATTGLFRIVVGLFKKIALADTLALAIVDRVFEAPERYSSVEVACGVYGYALQIYLDFSAYSDIAIGSALVLGFTLPENFRTPYRSATLQEFWRRWHISLSSWLRDYLYIALGGNRGSELRTYANLSATMLLGGLWHGANWTFIVWGGLHGFGLAITRYFSRASAELARDLAVGTAVVAIAGVVALSVSDLDPWIMLGLGWITLTPLWAVATAWLGRDDRPPPAPIEDDREPPGLPFRALFLRGERRDAKPPIVTVELVRIAMCVACVGVFVALGCAPGWTWIPLIAVVWLLAFIADVIERGTHDLDARIATQTRRAIAGVLVFHYVCLGWVFFRATSFDNALAVLRQIGEGSLDHANVVSVVSVALVAGGAAHLFADGSFRWLRRRFVAAPPVVQGLVLGIVAFVLRALAHHEITPFIYFQF